jgi:hypothetical protein
MLRGFVLRYLAAVATGSDYPVAARTVPALVRAASTKRARRVVSEVMLASSHADDAPHVHRVAYLRTIDREPPDHDDREAVKAAFAERRDEAGERRAPLVLVGWVAGLALALVGGAYAYVRATAPAPRYALPPPVADLPPPVAAPALTDATETAPAHPLEPVFREALPRWVVALDARSAGRALAPPRDVESAHAAVLEALADAHASDALATATRAFLEASEAHSAEASEEGADTVTRALLGLDDALAHEAAPFYVDAILTESLVSDRRRVLVTSFRVRARRTFGSTDTEDGPRRVISLDLERIDDLSFEQTLLGYTRPDVRYALVLTARVEAYLVTRALPAMSSPEESVIVHGYEDERDTAWVTPFETAVHEVLRSEARAMADERAVTALAASMARRRRAFETVAGELRGDGLVLSMPETYAYDLAPLEVALGGVDGALRRELREAQGALETADLGRAYRAIEEAYLLSIARHEAQHRLDYEDDRLVAVPDALARYTGRTESEDRVNHLAERANAELSAYLSQVAREPARAAGHLVFVSTFVMSRDSWGMPETYAALVIFESLARELGLVPAELVVAGRVVRGEIARLFLAMRARSGEELSAAAQRAWRALYGVELPPLELVP